MILLEHLEQRVHAPSLSARCAPSACDRRLLRVKSSDLRRTRAPCTLRPTQQARLADPSYSSNADCSPAATICGSCRGRRRCESGEDRGQQRRGCTELTRGIRWKSTRKDPSIGGSSPAHRALARQQRISVYSRTGASRSSCQGRTAGAVRQHKGRGLVPRWRVGIWTASPSGSSPRCRRLTGPLPPSPLREWRPCGLQRR